VAAACVAAGAISLAGCGSTTIKTVTDTTTAPSGQTPTSTEATDDTPAAQSSPQETKVGSTISLSGFDSVKMDVKVTRVLDPATGGEFDQPSPGTRYVGVEIELKNTGQVAYDDSPSNGATLITNTDEEADAEITLGGTCNSPSDVKIAPGDTRKVCIPFEVPNAQKARKFQFTLNSGFANETGEWSLT